ncbi:hypothetical protein OG875_13690 [Streptomyces sp. NBC_01498]|uniref:hypothetical protein n=1 Tax=Streptomyces sp. NBC_01498 TaxID=2975870 RepID=UPI002E7C41D2|nr:hypothetical protein [Streptomyces sp. NBC_01498]WTL25552.1 hypothetical protein OG875_13690 [Streptomyces sp. NBC_01498]
MPGVNRELGRSAEEERGEISVASNKGSIDRVRGMTVGCAFITDVLGERPRQSLVVSSKQGVNGFVATSGPMSCREPTNWATGSPPRYARAIASFAGASPGDEAP